MTKEERVSKSIFRNWWQDIQRFDEKGKPNFWANPAALARLRRCGSVIDAMTEDVTIDLFRFLKMSHASQLPDVALIAMTLAHVREDDKDKSRAILAVGRERSDDPESAKMSPLRFRRLLSCRKENSDDLAREMRRFIALAGKKVNVGDLGVSLYYWNDRTRAEWAFNYYGAGNAAPSHANT
ncbi:CRISPR system Cascade subunit CasB [Azospirillaceae bacterium]